MTQPTANFPGTAVAEPPAPILPPSGDDDGGADNRRKLLVVGVAVGVLLVAIVGFFLLKGGSSSSSDSGFVVPHHALPAKTTKAAQPGPVKLPKTVAAPVGRNPFTPLYNPPASAPAVAPAPASSGTTTSTTTTSSSTSSGTTTSTAPSAAYAPVAIELVSVNGTKSASFIVFYSNGKQSKTASFSNVLAPANGLRTEFGGVFSLLSIQDGAATVQFGDGSPFDLAPGASNRHALG